jgi:hypothetical protein
MGMMLYYDGYPCIKLLVGRLRTFEVGLLNSCINVTNCNCSKSYFMSTLISNAGND